MKNSVRLLTLVLAVLMLSAVAVGCAKPGDDTTDETTLPTVETTVPADDNTAETADPTKDENGFLKDELPGDLNYGGDTVNVLHWNAERDEFGIDSLTGDNIGDAIYQRNLNIQERLGVSLNFIKENGSVNYMDAFVKFVANSYNAGAKAYDIIATYGRTAAKLAVAGYYTDLNAIEDSHLDFEKPWWPDTLVDTVSVGDSLYYVSGDASTNTLHFMYTIYYNQQLLADYGLEDPTDLVLNHKWTLEKLISMTANSYQDLDADGKQSEGDFFGFGSIDYGTTAFYTGSGLKLMENTGDENLLMISPDYNSEKTINLLDTLGQWFNRPECWIEGATASSSNWKPFVDGRCLFEQNRVYIADNKSSTGLNSVDWKYGLVPNPLYDENQADYLTVVGNPFTLYGIENDCDSMEEMTAVIECWGSEAYRLTTPALFEVNMKYKYTDLDISAQMFDILRRTSAFDQGRVFDKVVDGLAENPMKCACKGASWAVQVKALQKQYEKMLSTKVIKPFQTLQGK